MKYSKYAKAFYWVTLFFLFVGALIFYSTNSKPEISAWFENVEIEKVEFILSEHDPKKIINAFIGFKVKPKQPLKINGETVSEIFVDIIAGTGHCQLFMPMIYPEKQYVFKRIRVEKRQHQFSNKELVMIIGNINIYLK